MFACTLKTKPESFDSSASTARSSASRARGAGACWTKLSSRVDLVPPAKVIGKSTVECMQSGLIYGPVAQVDGIVSRVVEEIGPPVAIVATGGLAELVVPLSEHAIDHIPQLTLEGLQRVYELNVHAEAT